MPPLLYILLLLAPAPVGAPPAAGNLPGGPQAALLGWMMRTARTGQPASEAHLQELLEQGEAVYLDGGATACAERFGAALLDATLYPLAGSVLHDNLKYDLAGALIREGALGQARHLLLDLISRTPESTFRAPAFHKLVDLTVESGQYEQALASVQSLPIQPSDDEKDEIAYLKGRALVQMGFSREAGQAFDTVSRTSRHRAAATYLSGILALQRGDILDATDRFCFIVRQPKLGKFNFFISAGAAQAIEHAWLALGSIRHDSGEHERAIDSYTKVTVDSPNYPAARYQSAWSLYRLDRFLEARRVLQDLIERAPQMAELAEAKLLLGYAYMGDCLYDRARETFDSLASRWRAEAEASTGLAKELPPPLTASLYQAVAPAKEEQKALLLARRVLAALGRLQGLRGQILQLASGMPLSPLPKPATPIAGGLQADISGAQGLKQRIIEIRAAAGKSALSAQQLAELDSLGIAVDRAAQRARFALWQIQAGNLGPVMSPSPVASDSEVPLAYLVEEQKEVVRLGLVLLQQLDAAEKISLTAQRSWAGRAAQKAAARARLASIGQIDAVIGQKQVFETEIQNLALGRYPLSLLKELAAAGLVDETQEYWPFDGEDWPDEVE